MKAAPRLVRDVKFIDNFDNFDRKDEVFPEVNLDTSGSEFTILPVRIQNVIERIYNYLNLLSILVSLFLIAIYLIGIIMSSTVVKSSPFVKFPVVKSSNSSNSANSSSPVNSKGRHARKTWKGKYSKKSVVNVVFLGSNLDGKISSNVANSQIVSRVKTMGQSSYEKMLSRSILDCFNRGQAEGVQYLISGFAILRTLRYLRFSEENLLNFVPLTINGTREANAATKLEDVLFFFKATIERVNGEIKIAKRCIVNKPDLYFPTLSVVGSALIRDTEDGNPTRAPFLLEYFVEEKDGAFKPFAKDEDKFLYLRRRDCENSMVFDEICVNENGEFASYTVYIDQSITSGIRQFIIRVEVAEKEVQVQLVDCDIGIANLSSIHDNFKAIYGPIFDSHETEVIDAFEKKILGKILYLMNPKIVKRFADGALHHVRGAGKEVPGLTVPNVVLDLTDKIGTLATKTVNFAMKQTTSEIQASMIIQEDQFLEGDVVFA